MSEEILENIETPIEEEIVEIPQRVNPFCVISKATFGEYAVHDIQSNSAWNENPYSDYAVVPDDMVLDIMATKGFCDIVLNEDGTEVVSFTTREIPEIPEQEESGDTSSEATADEIWDEMALAIEEGVNEV